MDSRHSIWNLEQFYAGSDEDSELSLQFGASNSGLEDNCKSSVQSFGSEPSLHISGRVISVTFTIPYRLQFREGKDDWVRMLQQYLPSLSFQLRFIIDCLRFRELTKVASRSPQPS
jgi:hypothetical protein